MHFPRCFKSLFLLPLAFLFIYAASPKKDFYQVRIYSCKSNEQIQLTEAYLKDAYVPALHKAGIKMVGVFKPLSNDTAAVKSIYVLLTFASEKDFFNLEKTLLKDDVYMQSSKSFREATAANPPYERLESVLLEAFDGQKHFVARTKSPGRIFEWRSYESPTEDLHRKKMYMFEKEEIGLFKKLQFNTVFYARVLSGPKMPNFVYMPSFESVDDRNEHWKTFGADPTWKAMQANPEYENKVSVSHIDSYLMKAADYSDF